VVGVFAVPADVARLAFEERDGAALAAAFLVGGTDLPPIWISYRGVIPRSVTPYTCYAGRTPG